MVGWLYGGAGNRKCWWRHNGCWQKTTENEEFENNDNLNEGSKSQFDQKTSQHELKEAVQKTAELENSEHLNEGSKSQVSFWFEQDFSAMSLILRGDLEEVVEKNA